MNRLEIFIYVLAILIVASMVTDTGFSSDFMNIVGAISGALSFIGVIACAVTLLWRRVKIRSNRKVFGDKADIVERSVEETVIYVAKGVAALWLLFVVIGFFEMLRQQL